MKQETKTNWRAFLKGLSFGAFGFGMVPYLIYKAVKEVSDHTTPFL
ncbi:hypothetical protein [Paenibacillus daejeonensis]|nr:hypothetical protein [Paenibacillus daejeonensis]